MDKQFKKNILKGSASTSVGTIASMIFQFLSVMIMTRYVSKEDFGIYVLIIVAVNFFNLLGGLGLELTMVKWIASGKEEERNYILYPVLRLRALSLIFIGALFFFTGKLLLSIYDPRLIKYIPLIVGIFIFANFRDLFYNLLQGLNRFIHYASVNIISAIFRFTVVLVVALLNKLNIETLIYLELLFTVVSVILQSVVIPFKKLLNKPKTSETYKRIIKFSLPLYMTNMVVFFNGRVNIFIIGAYLNAASIALFDVASKIPQAMRRLLKSFIIVYFPNLSKLFSKDDSKTAVTLMGKSLNVLSLVMMFVVIIAFLFREEIVVLLFSAKYTASAMAFAVLVFNVYLRALADLMGYSFVPAGYPKVSAIVNTIGSVVSITCSILLIPIYGFIGAAYSLLIMNTISIALYYSFLRKYHISPRVKEFIAPLLMLFVAIGIYYLAGIDGLVFKLIFLAVIIGASWFLLDEFKKLAEFGLKQFQSFLMRRKSA